MMYMTIQLMGLPLVLHCLENGSVVFQQMPRFYTVIDVTGEFKATFSDDGFSINGEEFSYGVAYAYKEEPSLLGWLKEQQM